MRRINKWTEWVTGAIMKISWHDGDGVVSLAELIINNKIRIVYSWSSVTTFKLSNVRLITSMHTIFFSSSLREFPSTSSSFGKLLGFHIPSIGLTLVTALRYYCHSENDRRKGVCGINSEMRKHIQLMWMRQMILCTLNCTEPTIVNECGDGLRRWRWRRRRRLLFLSILSTATNKRNCVYNERARESDDFFDL